MITLACPRGRAKVDLVNDYYDNSWGAVDWEPIIYQVSDSFL